MSRSDEQRLADIRDACATLALLADRGRAAFEDDTAIRLAMERLLEIIGESSAALSPEVRHRYTSVPWRDITRLRIRLAHHYHRIDPEQVWAIVTTDVPALLAALNTEM